MLKLLNLHRVAAKIGSDSVKLDSDLDRTPLQSQPALIKSGFHSSQFLSNLNLKQDLVHFQFQVMSHFAIIRKTHFTIINDLINKIMTNEIKTLSFESIDRFHTSTRTH